MVLSLTAPEPASAAPRADLVADWRYGESSGDLIGDGSGAVAATEQTESSAAAAMLVAQWNLDAGSGTQLYDEVSGSNGGAIVGARWSPYAPLLSGRQHSLSFDGDGDYADTGKTFDIDSDFTITAWIYPYSFAANNIVGKHTSGGDNQVLVGLYGGAYHVRIFGATLNVTDTVNGWQHIAVTGEETATGTVVKIYRDGLLLHSEELAAKVGAVGGGKAWTIGQDWDGDTRTDFFMGNIGEVRIYNGVLSQAELDDILDFGNIRVANDDFWSNAGALACFTPLGIAHNVAWGGSWTAPPPLDVALDAAVYSTNLALKLCAPYVSPRSNLVFDQPDDEEQCTVTLDQSAMGGSYENVLGLPDPGSEILPGTDWGALGTPEVVHWNTDVELSARYPGWFNANAGKVTFGTGVNLVTWRGDTMVHPLDFIPIYWPGPNPDRKSLQVAIKASEELIDIIGSEVIDSPIEPYGIYNEELQYVVVKDFVAPTISVNPSLADVSVEAIEPGGVSRVRFEHILRDGLVYSDNCDDNPTVTAINLPLFANVGEVYTITWKVEDDGPRTVNGGRNSASVQQILRVVDTKPPIMLAPPAIVTETVTIPAAINIGHPGVFDLADLDPTVSNDACVQPGVICPPDGLPEFPAGQTTVTWTATDQSGNSASVTQLVNVKAPGANTTPTADGQSAEAISFEPITLTLTAADADADPLWFSTVTQPTDGFFKAPLLPYFIADYRVDAKGVVLEEYCHAHPGEVVYTNWPIEAMWMAVDDDDNVYVFDNGAVVCDGSDGSVHQEYRIAKIMPDGTYIQTGPSAVPDTTKSINIDYGRGHIVAADPGSNHGNPWVHQFDLDTLETVGHYRVDYATYPPGTTDGLQTADHAIADEQGILYVSGYNRIWLFDTDFSSPYGDPMHGLVEYADFDYQEVHDLALDSDLNFYVSVGNRIYKWSPATLDADHNFTPGELVGWLGACSEGPDCDVANQRSFGYRCTDATCSGLLSGSRPGQFGRARGIAMGPNDVLYVTDSGNQRVQRFTQNGYFAGQAVSECDGSCFTLGDFGRPKQVTVNTNHFYVLDTSSELLHIFETTPIKPLSDTTAEIVYQSNNNFVGTDSFLYQVTDGLATSSPATVTIGVTRNFRPPQTYRYDEPYQTNEDTGVTIPLLGYDPDESFDTLTYQIVSEPDHGTVTSEGLYTPVPDFFGTDTFQFVADDGLFQSDPRTVTVTVSAENDPPRFPSESGRTLAYRAAAGATFNPTRLMTLDEISVGRGFMAAFTVEYSDPDEAELHTVVIDWGDGEVELEGKALEDGTITGPLLLQSTRDASGMVTANHVYTTSGNYTMQICVTDNMEMVEDEKQPTAASTTTCKEIAVSVMDMVDLTVDLDSAHNPLGPADPLVFTAKVLNQAPEQGVGVTATDVRVTVTLPEEVTYVAAITSDGTCQQDAGELVCQMSDLAPGSSAEIVIQATVDNHIAGDTLETTAIVETSAINQVEVSFDYEKVVLVGAADYVVDTIADTADADSNDGICADSDGNCSLRAAIEQANSSGNPRIIALGDGVYEIAEVLRTSSDVELIGLGATRTIVRNRDAEKVFFAESGSLTIRNMGISGGVLNFEADVLLDNVAISGADGQEPNYGGGLYNVRGETTVRNSSITGNRATQGGGVYNGGTLTMVNVTVSGNSADTHGGISNNGALTLTHVTISHNQAQSGAGGLGLGDSMTTTLQHTLIGKNKAGTTAADCTGSFTSSGHNLLESGCESSLVSSDLSGVDPRLETLNLNGAETLTVGLQEDSPAIDAGGSTISVDQRGMPRDSAADIGAYELVAAYRIVYLPVIVR
jgi:CSLREA domain-containing protein